MWLASHVESLNHCLHQGKICWMGHQPDAVIAECCIMLAVRWGDPVVHSSLKISDSHRLRGIISQDACAKIRKKGVLMVASRQANFRNCSYLLWKHFGLEILGDSKCLTHFAAVWVRNTDLSFQFYQLMLQMIENSESCGRDTVEVLLQFWEYWGSPHSPARDLGPLIFQLNHLYQATLMHSTVHLSCLP